MAGEHNGFARVKPVNTDSVDRGIKFLSFSATHGLSLCVPKKMFAQGPNNIKDGPNYTNFPLSQDSPKMAYAYLL